MQQVKNTNWNEKTTSNSVHPIHAVGIYTEKKHREIGL